MRCAGTFAPTTPSLRDTPPQAGGEFFFELSLLILLILSIFVLVVIGVHRRQNWFLILSAFICGSILVTRQLMVALLLVGQLPLQKRVPDPLLDVFRHGSRE